MSLTLTQLLTPLENKILDENKSLQKDFVISSLYSFCYYKELISTLHIMAFMSYEHSSLSPDPAAKAHNSCL